MIQLKYYKLPSESGENVILTDTYIYRDSELAITIGEEDLLLPFFNITFNTEDENSSPISVFVPREDMDTVDEPYFVIDDTGVTAFLPFKDVNSASSFAREAYRRYQLIKDQYDV